MAEDESIYDIADISDSLFSDVITGLKRHPAGGHGWRLLLCRFLNNGQGNFNSWASHMGVFADSTLSLDCRLENYPHIREMCVSLLQVLRRSLEELKTWIGNLQFQELSDDLGHAVELEQAKELIDGSLDRLHRLGTTIRQSSTASLAARVKTFAEKQPMSSLEEIASLIVRTLYPRIAPDLHKRLSQSMLERYFRLQYKREHQQRLAQRRSTTSTSESVALSEVKIEEERQEPTVYPIARPDAVNRMYSLEETAKTEVSKPSTLQPSEFNRRERGERRERIEASPTSTVASSVPMGDITYPKPPKPKKKSFKFSTCEWCNATYGNDKFECKRWWRRHVDRDMMTYICLFKNCNSPETTFDRFSHWRAHMERFHTFRWLKNINRQMTWRCDFDNQLFEDRPSLESHMVETHLDLLSADQISTIAEKGWALLQMPEDACALCGFKFVPEPAAARPHSQRQNRQLKRRNKNQPGTKGKKPRVHFADDSADVNMQLESSDDTPFENSSDCAEDEVDDATNISDDGMSSQSRRTAMMRHLAAHLKAIAFLSIRLSSFQSTPQHPPEDDVGSCASSWSSDDGDIESCWDSDIKAIDLTYGDDVEFHSDLEHENNSHLESRDNSDLEQEETYDERFVSLKQNYSREQIAILMRDAESYSSLRKESISSVASDLQLLNNSGILSWRNELTSEDDLQPFRKDASSTVAAVERSSTTSDTCRRPAMDDNNSIVGQDPNPDTLSGQVPALQPDIDLLVGQWSGMPAAILPGELEGN